MSRRPEKPLTSLGLHQKKKRPRRFWPLRVKLILAGLCVQMVVTGVIVWTEIRETEDSVGKELALRVKHTQPLLNAALIDPLIQRDYATLNQVLAETQDSASFKYLLLLDADKKVLASGGKTPPFPLPPLDTADSNLKCNTLGFNE